MDVRILASHAELSQRGAAIVAGLLRSKPDAVLGLPTGSTPLALYALLAESGVTFTSAMAFNLDEFVGVSREDPNSFATYLRQHLLDRIDLPPAQTHLLDGAAADPEAECRRHEAALQAAGGLDLAILGLGLNGHIGYNEPGSPFASRTRPIMLTEESRRAQASQFGELERVPAAALTMGIGTILEARHLLMLVSGEAKAGIVRAMLEGPVTEQVPATALRAHPNVTVLLDQAAARLISP